MAREVEQERSRILVGRKKTAWSPLRIDFLVPLLFVGTVVLAFLIMMGGESSPSYIKYSTVMGFFQQDDPATDPGTFDYTTTNFGLIDRSYDGDYDPDHTKTQWQRFEHQVLQYNQESGQRVRYKVLYRYHNVAESYYGREAWDCYWSLKDGNDTVLWADAQLTPAGAAQAVKAHDFWNTMITDQKIPTPESYYVSPLTRCLETARLTFSNLPLPDTHPFIPQVNELFREAIGVHTCDRRSSKSYIAENYPSYTFEEGFAEEDPLWSATVRETDSVQDARSKIVLDDVFSSDESTFVSITSHSGEITSLLRVLGHRKFGLGTGQVIPVLVKAETVDGTAPTSTVVPSTTVSTCATPPATSTL